MGAGYILTLTLKANGKVYGGWKSIQVTRSMEALSGSFSLSISERFPGQASTRGIKPGDSCEVLLGADRVITGYVDQVSLSLDASTHTVEVTGRDKAGDLLDCAAIYPTGQWSGQTLEQIASTLIAPFGMTISSETPTGQPFKKFALQQGETVFEAIERMCRLRGVLAIAAPDGHILITRAGSTRASTALEEGKNILRGSAEFSHNERFSTITVKGQTQGNDQTPGKVSTQGLGTAADKEIKRYRPQLIVAEGQSNSAQCQQRAQWEVAVRSGRSKQISITVNGWRQRGQAGPLWAINTLVPVKAPLLAVETEMLIVETSFSLDANGELTELKLLRPEAYSLIPELETKEGLGL